MLKVNVLNIKKGEFVTEHVIIFPKDKTGGFLENIKKKLNIKPENKTKLNKKIIINDISIFKTDYIKDIKGKISAVVDIHTKKQFLFPVVGHTFYIDGIVFEIDPNELLKPYNDDNNFLYKYKGNYHYDDKSYNQIGDINEINVLSIDEFIHDKNEIMYYYCKKFWPMLTQDEYNSKIPNYPVKQFDKYKMESKIYPKILKEKPVNNVYVDKSVIYINKYFTSKLLNLSEIMKSFDLSVVNADFVHLYKNKHIVKYIDKYNLEDVEHDAINIHQKVKNMSILTSIYPTGKIMITSHHHVDLKYLVEILDVNSASIVNYINILDQVNLTRTSMLFDSLHVTFKYMNVITSTMFNLLSELNSKLSPLLILSNTISDEAYHFSLYKGLKHGPYHVHIINAHTKLLVKVDNIHYDDIEYINNFVSYYFRFISDKEVVDINIDGINKNKRLQERDPVAYPLRINWSSNCQQPKQAVIFNETEYNKLKPDVKKRIVKYHNFTTELPAYYLCPNPKFPNLWFKEADGRGLPCCGIRSLADANEESKKLYQNILKTHVYIKSQENASSRYISTYGKLVGIGRLIKIPDVLHKWIKKNNIKQSFDYLTFGLSQSIGILGIYLHALNITPSEFMAKIKGNVFETEVKDAFDNKTFGKRWEYIIEEVMYKVYSINLIMLTDKLLGEKMELKLVNNKYTKENKYIIIIKQKRESITYFPIYGINIKVFNIQKKIDLTLFDLEDPLINLFISYKKNEPLPINDWKIVKHHIYKNIILYVLLKKNDRFVLLPLNMSIRQDVDKKTVLPPDLKLNMPYKDIINLTGINDYNTVLIYKDKQIGFVYNNLMYFHNNITQQKDKHRIFINYDISNVFSAIYNDLEPTNDKRSLIDKIIKEKQLPEVIISKLSNYFFSKKNMKIRDQIRKIYKLDINNMLYKLYDLLGKKDYMFIKNLVIKKKNINDVLSFIYDFDSLELDRVMKLNIKDEIKKIAKKINITISDSVATYVSVMIENPLLHERFKLYTEPIYIKNIRIHNNEMIKVL